MSIPPPTEIKPPRAQYLSPLKGGLRLGLNEILGQAGSFARSVIIARLISTEDFGVAATLALTFSLLQMISNLATETLLVQAENGDDPIFQETAHAVQAFRGTVLAVVLLVTAGPIARLFGVLHAKWAFACLALVPLIKGLAHTDTARLQRAGRFGPFIRVNIWTTCVVTAAALPLVLWLRSYAAMVWVLLIQAACTTVASHLIAERPYRWSWNRQHVSQMFAFGWPLLINGMLMYLIFQGDRLVIGASERLFSQASYTLTDLAIYSLALSVVQMPTMLVSNVCTSLFLPALSRTRSARAQFDEDYLACSLVVCLAAALTSGPLIIAGGWLVGLIYGPNYSSAGSVIMWLAAMQAARIIRTAPTLGAIALGDTRNLMMSNVLRTPAFVVVLLIASAGGSLPWIAACGLVGEVPALGYGLWRLWSRHRIAPRLCLGPCAVVAVGLAVGAAARRLGPDALGGATALLASVALVVLVFFVMVFAYPRLRTDLQALAVW